jgi:hypothetical protein
MTNALQVNQSTVVGGTGTQSFTVTTAGLYTLSFKSSLPYQPAGSPAPSANPTQNIQTVTTVADSGGSLNSTWFKFYSATDLQGFYVWYNINSAGVDPAPAGLTGIAVTGATGASANTLATATRTAIAANTAAASYVTVSGATNAIILTNTQYGACTAAADGTAATGFGFSTGTAGSFGTPATSGLTITLKQNSTVLGRYGFPTPTQPIMGGYASFNASASDVISVVISSLSTADASLNAVKTIVNLFQGAGQ